MKPILNEFINEVLLEKRIREADVTGGSKVPWGSRDHVSDLKKRISELDSWRSKQPRGSEARANYSRLINKLKSELSSAMRASSKKSSPQKQKKLSPLEDAKLMLADAEAKAKYDPEEAEMISYWQQIIADLESNKSV